MALWHIQFVDGFPHLNVCLFSENLFPREAAGVMCRKLTFDVLTHFSGAGDGLACISITSKQKFSLPINPSCRLFVCLRCRCCMLLVPDHETLFPLLSIVRWRGEPFIAGVFFGSRDVNSAREASACHSASINLTKCARVALSALNDVNAVQLRVENSSTLSTSS